MSRLLLCFPLCLALFAAPQPQAKNAAAKAPAAPAKADEKKSAWDKKILESYVRHLNVWGPQITVEISDPKPAPMPGFSEVNVHASAGGASGDFTYYISKDGQKIIQGTVF